jgi:hypothetical protein
MPFQIIDNASMSAIVQTVSSMVSYSISADPGADTDPAVQQMVQAANLAGQDLLSMHDWQELSKPHTISIAADAPGQTEKAFDLPVDFGKFIDQTQWNSSMQWPAIGPIMPQAWQQLLVRQTLPTLSFYWQVRDGKLYVLSPPTSAQNLTFYYQSVAWVRDQDDNTLFKNRLVKNGDTCLIEPYLVTLLTRVKWLEMKGLDSAAAMRDFQVAYENRKGNEKGGAPVLNMTTSHRFPYLNAYQNLPDTGIGI